MKRGFASDNNAGVHLRVLDAIAAANAGHAAAYGDDRSTLDAVAKFREQFGEGVEVFFVFGGTGANVVGLASVVRPHQAVICAATSHINVDECGALERFAGCKVIAVPTRDGKLRVEDVEPLLSRVGDPHASQPRVVSVSQPTELGTVYTTGELRRLSDFARGHGMLLHVDGARLSNAAAHLDLSLRETTRDAGVDILSFGGTKNGMMYGEAVVCFDALLARDLAFTRKQGMQLASKMRFIAAQFTALLTNDLWRENAAHANRMARLLASELSRSQGVKITQAVESNAVFAVIPRESVARVQSEYPFYFLNEENSEVRFMCSFDTTEEDVRGLVRAIERAVAR